MRLYVTIFIVLFYTGAAHAGAWLQPMGKGLLINQINYYGTADYFDNNGHLQAQPRLNKYEFQPYVEYGLFDNLTIGGSASMQSITQSGRHNEGLADPEFFARIPLWKNEKQLISLQPLIKLSSNFTDDHSPRGGSRSSDAEISLLYGRSMAILTRHDYIDMRLGYRVRNHDLSNQLRMDASLGIKPAVPLEIIAALRSTAATNPADMDVYIENGERDYDMLKAEITGIYHLNDEQWLQMGLLKPVSGAQTGSGYALSIGFAQRF